MNSTIFIDFIHKKNTLMNRRDRKDEEWKTAMQVVRSAEAKQKTQDRERKTGYVANN